MKKDKDLEVLIKAAHAGGEVLRKYFGQVLNVVEKSTLADFKTEADLESEKAIIKVVKTELPLYNIHSEEEGKTENNSDYAVIIDPLDGTNNFVIGIPNFSVSVALFYKNQAIAGVIYNSILNQTYFATKNKGAFLNKKKIKVNNVTNPKKITIASVFTYKTELNYLGRLMNSLFSQDHKRTINSWSGAYDFCLLASGKIESIICDGPELHDYAAGKLIALEAGAKIVDFTGKKEKNYINNNFIISNTNEINKYVLNIMKPLKGNRALTN